MKLYFYLFCDSYADSDVTPITERFFEVDIFGDKKHNFYRETRLQASNWDDAVLKIQKLIDDYVTGYVVIEIPNQ